MMFLLLLSITTFKPVILLLVALLVAGVLLALPAVRTRIDTFVLSLMYAVIIVIVAVVLLNWVGLL